MLVGHIYSYGERHTILAKTHFKEIDSLKNRLAVEKLISKKKFAANSILRKSSAKPGHQARALAQVGTGCSR